MRLRALGLVCAVGLLVSVASGAGAHDHRPPRDPVLEVDAEAQKGRPILVSWLRRFGPDECGLGQGWNDLRFPAPIRVVSGSPAVVRLQKSAPPVEWEVRTWDRLDRRGRARGEGVVVPAVLAAGHVSPGSPQKWSLHFVPNLTAKHLYIQVDVFWADEEGCSAQPDLGSQSGRWTYHLRAE